MSHNSLIWVGALFLSAFAGCVGTLATGAEFYTRWPRFDTFAEAAGNVTGFDENVVTARATSLLMTGAHGHSPAGRSCVSSPEHLEKHTATPSSPQPGRLLTRLCSSALNSSPGSQSWLVGGVL